MKKQIYVIMATYNGEKYVEEQIDSILKQTYKNIKLVISDDCSKDNTRKILQKYEKEDERVEVYYQEKNLGCIKNFEFLLSKVQSEIFMFSDQDDVWLPEKIEKTYEKMQKEQADLVFGDLEVVDKNLNTIYKSYNDFMKLSDKIKKTINTKEFSYLYNLVTGCTMMVKSKWIKEFNPLPEKNKYVLHDHWISLIISLNGKVAYVPEKYIKYRQHGDNEVGVDKISHHFNKFEQVRNHFIDVKIGVFGVYVQNKEKFPKEMQKTNQEVYDYFKMLKTKNKINFRGWNIFYRIYKNEKKLYYLENFIIMNTPCLGKILFKIRYAILKALKRR